MEKKRAKTLSGVATQSMDSSLHIYNTLYLAHNVLNFDIMPWYMISQVLYMASVSDLFMIHTCHCLRLSPELGVDV